MQEKSRLDLVRVKTFVGTMVGAAIVSIGIATAQGAGDRDQLRMLGQCRGRSFEDLDVGARRMIGVDLGEATLRNVTLSGSALNVAIFDFAVLKNVSIAHADLDGASFRGARLINVSFEDAELRGTVFEDATLMDTDLQAGHLCNTQMPNQTTDNSDCA